MATRKSNSNRMPARPRRQDPPATNAEPAAGYRQIVDRLYRAGHSLLVIYDLALNANAVDRDASLAMTNITELARSTFRGVDACIRSLEDGGGIGGFESEFADAVNGRQVRGAANG